MVLVGMIAAEVSAATSATTSVTIVNANSERFTGRVTSPKKACMKNRRVTLYMKISAGRSYEGYRGFEVVGKATTKSNGNWEARASEAFLEGDYRAFVASRRVMSGDQVLLCMSRWGPTTHA